ncbi:MAG: hypothetical protein WCG27_05990 [Pseudomonadota bacterium]
MAETTTFEAESSEMNRDGTKSKEVDFEKALNTEDAIMVGAKTMAGIGIGFVVVVIGATGLGAILEAKIIPTALAKVAGAIAGGGIGMAMGITDARKEKDRRKRSLAHYRTGTLN